MALTRLDNLISSKTGKYLYVSPDDFNASDELNNRGNSPIRPFRSIQRAFIEIARYSYLPGADNDRFDQFTIMLMPGIHYIDNRPGLVDAAGIDTFGFDQALSEWTDSSSLDLSDPDNCLYKFNNTEGGAIIPRGSSLVGYDLRRTAVHPLYVPDPADRLEKRSAIFNVTGGCYFWQFTIRDGDLEPGSPLYDNVDGVGKVYNQSGDWTSKAVPNFSHHKLTVFEYADKEELSLYYQKVAKAFSQYQPTIDDANEFGDRIQETRIVGPLSDIRAIDSIKCTDLTGSDAGKIEVTVSTKVNHGYFKNQFIAIENNGLDDQLDGTFAINDIDGVDLRKFTYHIAGSTAGTLGLVSGKEYTTTSTPQALGANAAVKAEVDSVESASPYVFNCSIRSTWGICGIWANGLKATGFKSMVIAQYTGVSLQKDDRAFIRYDEYTNTFNQASLKDAFATVPYHTKGDAFWKDDWRNFHVRASEDAFIQCVSIFAVGFADHFLMESGGDMSITNSNSNFGNTSLHAIGHKGFAFNQDKGGFITDIVPPETVIETSGNTKKNAYYTLDVQASNDPDNHTKIYIGDDLAYDPAKRPAASIDGYRIGAKKDDKINVKLTPRAAGMGNEFQSTLSPSGFKVFSAAPDVLNPSGATVNNADLDAANRIEANKDFIAYEAYGYITSKYPALLVNENITITKCRRDIGYLVDAAVQDLRLGGNINTIQAAESYFVATELSYINHELSETLEGYDYARDLAIAAARNFKYLRTNSNTTQGSSIVNVGDTSGIVQGMTVLDYEPSSFTNGELNATPTRPASPAIPSNTFVKRVIDASSIEIGQKATYSEYKVVSDRHGDAANLIEANKTFIAEEAHARILLDYPGYTYYTGINAATGNPYTTAEAKAKCIDDIELALNKVAKDTAFGGNAETWDAAYYYDSGAVLDLANKKDETLTALNYAKDMAVQVMRKEDVFVFGTHGLTQVKTTSQLANPIATKDGHALDPITSEVGDVVSDKGGDAQKLIAANKNLIAHEAVERMVLQSSTGTFTPGNGTTYNASTGNLTIASVGHGLTGASTITATNAAYDPSTGILTLTKNSHGMANGEKIQIVDESIWFKCTMDNKTSVKKYPRATDPVSGKWLTISNVQTSTFDVNVGKSLFVNFTPTAADYNPTTGLMTLTIGNHGLSAGTSIKLIPESLKFSCGFNGATGTSAEKSYPRSGGADSATYDKAINIESVTSTTITIQVLPSTPSSNTDPHTFVSALPGAVISGGNYTHEIDQVASGGIKRANDSVRIDYDALTFTCGMDNDATEHKYPRISDPAASSILPISDTTNDTFVVNVGKTLSSTYDVSDASYNQTTGDLVLTINDHNLVKGSSIRLADGSLSFKCAKDAYATPHSYPRATDPAYQTGLEITDVGSSYHSATDGSYDPGTGILNLTVAGHGFSNGNRVRIADHSLTFTCGMDGNATEHSYPRASDDASGKWLEISDVDNDSFSVNVGAAGATQEFTPGTLSTYDPVSGDLVLDIGSHTLATGEGIVIDDNALSFTCTMDGNDSEKTYPRPLLDQAASRTLPITSKTDSTITVNVGGAGTDKYFQPTAATYDQKTGDMTVTIGQHGLRVGSNITLKDNSLKFTCDRDNHQTTHSYPRVGTDPKAGKSIDIDEVGYITKTATNAVYTPSNGLIVITSSGHGFVNGDYVQIADDSLTFSCDLGTGDKTYPRAGFDYPSGRWLVVTNATNDTFSINVGTSSNSSVHSFEGAANNGIRKQDGTIKFNVGQTNITNYTPGNATEYNPTTGDLVLDIGTHSLQTGSRIKIADGAIKFTCTEGAGEHAYPRATDPASGKSLNIIATTSTTVTVNVLDTIPSTNVTVHTFVPNSGVVNSITAGDDYEHTFVPGPENVDAVEYKPQSIHTFVTAVPNSVKQLPLSTHQFVRGSSNGVEKQSGTITINVGAAANGADQFEHQFNAAGTLAGAVISGGDYTHTWISAVADSVHKVFSVGGSNSYHNQDCVDDVNDLLDAIGHNVAYGGNDKTWDAAYSYKTGNHVAGVKKTVTAATYTPASGVMTLTIGTHSNSVGDRVKIPQNALRFTCAKDNNATNHDYPRATDPVASYDPVITAVTATTITFNVGPANDNTAGAHTFVSASKQIEVGGEGTETNVVFEYAKEMAAQVIRRQKVLCIGSHGYTQDYNPDGPITADIADPPVDRFGDARNLLESNKAFIAKEAYARMILNNAGFLPPTGNKQDCIDDIADFVTEIAYNVGFGGNDRTWDMANLYVTGAHVAGEEEQTLAAFKDATEIMVQVMRQEKVLAIGSHGLTQTYDPTISTQADAPLDNRVADAKNLILSNKNFVAEIALGRMTAQYPSYTYQVGYSSADCLDDLKDVVEVVAHNMAHGGNDRVWDAANMYVAGAHASGSENETIYSFNQVRDLIREVMTNVDVTVGSHTSLTQVKDTSITNGVADGRCDSAKSSVTSLVQILTNTIGSPSSLANVVRTQSVTRCEQVRSSINTLSGIVTNAISNPGSLAAITRTRSVGLCEDVRATVDTLFDIVKNTVTSPSSLESVHRTLSNGPCQTVAGSATTLFSIITSTISNNGYLNGIERNATPKGLAFGPSVNADASTTNSYLFFSMDSGVYTSEHSPDSDSSFSSTAPNNQDQSYPKCATQATAIRQYFANISTIIQTGLDTVPRNEPSSASSDLSSRTTIWNLDDPQTAGSNPHNLETGTPVRLVPRPRKDANGNVIDVDKRFVRLPNGFSTNTKYYVIAPGRDTQPEQYKNTGFTSSDQTKIMLANSKENAAAGIYIHSAEVEGIHPDIAIDLYQFVLDDKYDVHAYTCTVQSTPSGAISTDVPHIFDVPTANTSGHEVFFKKNEGGQLPIVGTSFQQDTDVSFGSRLREDQSFWARYVDKNTFTIHKTKDDAQNNTSVITFNTAGQKGFSVFCNKRESCMRFDPTYANPSTNPQIYGKWYLQVKNESQNPSNANYTYSILTRLHEAAYNDLSGIEKTNDSWFERIKDERDADDRIYRLRYVVPQYLKSVRDPLNGFTIKIRKDTTRKLLPQKILLLPVVANADPKAVFYNPAQPSEKIGATKAELEAINGHDNSLEYDPFRKPQSSSGPQVFAKTIRTNHGLIDFTIQSGRYVNLPSSSGGIDALELTVMDPGITSTIGLLNEKLTTVKIDVPQGGNFVASASVSNDSNKIEWAGNCSGSGYIHAALNVPGTDTWHLILKGIVRSNVSDTEALYYDSNENTRFTQVQKDANGVIIDSVFADLLSDRDFGKSLETKDLIDKHLPQYYYKQKGAKVYTLTPGDVVTAQNNNTDYYIASVEDVGELDDTFYIFDVQEVQRRIFDQQDGIYYLTAIRGDVSPMPTGAGNQNNFRNFKFSQPISKLYPLNYKNDPLWFKQLDTAAIDPPRTYSAADNYIHGLVTVNDFKGSMTKESIFDILKTDAFTNKTFTGDNEIQSQSGNATSGSEDRLIPIAGDSTVASDQRLYIELRRPSIARAGNHTFEYLGFGPGNYSTGLPQRQEVVLEPIQDFYSQSKKEDGGLVFYTGLNSNGDLYIGNRKIDAITGEEEFLESAKLVDSDDDAEDIGSLVTTFDTPVTFNEYITVNGGDNQDKTSTFNSPVTINVLGRIREPSLKIISGVDPNQGDDASLASQNQYLNQDTFGHIVLAKNRIAASVFQFNPRGSSGAAQGYKIQNHVVGNLGSNITPNQDSLISSGGSAIDSSQFVQYGNAGAPLAGDMLLKGNDVNRSGSLGWIYANSFAEVATSQIKRLIFDGTSVVTIEWEGTLENVDLGVTSGSQLKITGFSDSALNGTWTVIPNGFIATAQTCQFSIIENRANVSNDNPRDWNQANEPNAQLFLANSSWKEFSVLGAETIRTKTDHQGDYRLGVNTIARSNHDAYLTGFVSDATDPRANLDVVGSAFISGKSLVTYDADDIAVTANEYKDEALLVDRAWVDEDNAFVVGGDSREGVDPLNLDANANPIPYQDNEATLRVATTNGGRVGINITNQELDRALVVDGTSRFTNDAKFQQDIEVDGGNGAGTAEIRTGITTGTFEFVMDNTFTGTTTGGSNGLKIGGSAQNIEIGDQQSNVQTWLVGNASTDSTFHVGFTDNGNGSEVSKLHIGGAYTSNESNSYVEVGTKSFIANGDVWIGGAPSSRNKRGETDTVNLYTGAGTVDFFSNSGGPSTIKFATNASDLSIAGQGGTTTINNKLQVNASAKFLSDIWLCGGTSSFEFTGDREQMGSTSPTNGHPAGTASPFSDINPDKNIDILNVIVKLSTEEGYNRVDTDGSRDWGGAADQAALSGTGYSFPALTGDHYYLPLKNEPVKVNGDPYFVNGDYLIIDTGITAGTYPEVVQIVELTRTNAAPYIVKVVRQPFGTFTGTHAAHPDTTDIFRVNVQFDSTWTTQPLDNTGPQDAVYLAEFGGSLTTNDYIIAGRSDTTSDGINDTGEVIGIAAILGQQNQVLKVTNCQDPDKTMFEVDSVTGEVTIGNPDIPGSSVNINTTIKLKGGCGTIKSEIITATATSGSSYLTGISAADIAKVEVGDVVRVDTSMISALTEIATNYVTEVTPNGSNSTIKLRDELAGGYTLTSVQWFITQNETLTLTNGKEQQNFNVDSCTGIVKIGNHIRRVDAQEFYPASRTPVESTSDWSSIKDDVRVHSYWQDPLTLNLGKRTIVRAAVTAHGTYDWSIPVNGLPASNGAFEVGDLLIVGSPSDISTSPAPGLHEILIIREIDETVGAEVLVCDGAQEGSTAAQAGDYSVNDVIVALRKHPESSRLIDLEPRTRTTTNDYLSVILDTGYIVQSTIDYIQYIRFENISTGTNTWFKVNSNMEGTVHKPNGMRENPTFGTLGYGTGGIEMGGDLTMIGGDIRVYDSVNKSLLLKFGNDKGHAEHLGTLQIDAGIIAKGDFYMYPSDCPEHVFQTPQLCTTTFSIDNDGDVTVGKTLEVVGLPAVTPSSGVEVFKVGNLGTSGVNSLSVKHTGEIAAFGVDPFWTKSGGIHTRYVSSGSDAADKTLIPNIIYLTNTTSTSTLVLTLPESPDTGDIVKIVDVSGNLDYQTSLVIRAPGTGVNVQGDSTGTTLGGLGTAYPSGELVVQTPNAGFALIYLGSVASNGQVGIPTTDQGWWLLEV